MPSTPVMPHDSCNASSHAGLHPQDCPALPPPSHTRSGECMDVRAHSASQTCLALPSDGHVWHPTSAGMHAAWLVPGWSMVTGFVHGRERHTGPACKTTILRFSPACVMGHQLHRLATTHTPGATPAAQYRHVTCVAQAQGPHTQGPFWVTHQPCDPCHHGC